MSRRVSSQLGSRGFFPALQPPELLSLQPAASWHIVWDEGRMGPVRIYLNTPLMAHPRYPFPWPWSSLSIPLGVEHCYVNDRGLEISSRFATGSGERGGEKNDCPQKTGRRDKGGWKREGGVIHWGRRIWELPAICSNTRKWKKYLCEMCVH